MIICLGLVYPCMNCVIPIANSGDDFDVINGGSGKLDGSYSYDPDNFELELTYFWYADENIISYCGNSDGDKCSEKKYYCEGYEEVFTIEAECVSNNHVWVEGIYEDNKSCSLAGYVWAHTDLKNADECISADYIWNSRLITIDDVESNFPNITNINLGTITTAERIKIQLIVNDGQYDSEPDEIIITVNPLLSNTIPIANAGFYQNGFKGDEVILNGSASFDTTNTGIMNYTWSSESATPISFTESDPSSPYWVFSIPSGSSNGDISEELEFKLVVNDGLSVDSEPRYVTVNAVYNFQPIADAGPDITYPVESLVLLNGSSSYDIDNTGDLSYEWEQISGNQVTLSSLDTDTLSFSAPASADTLIFELRIHDTQDASDDWSAQDLFISEYANGAHDIYFEIYNGTGAAVNLSNYEL